MKTLAEVLWQAEKDEMASDAGYGATWESEPAQYVYESLSVAALEWLADRFDDSDIESKAGMAIYDNVANPTGDKVRAIFAVVLAELRAIS